MRRTLSEHERTTVMRTLEEGSAYLSECGIGKRIRQCVYCHRDAVGHLSFVAGLDRLWRSFDPSSCWNVLKIDRHSENVSTLNYPGFDTDAHPVLLQSNSISIVRNNTLFRTFGHHRNRPVLHRKELLLARDDPRWDCFHRLTAAEEREGLLENPSSVGYLEQWEYRLSVLGYRIVDHSLSKTGSQA